ncbi:glucose/arabinose dehydrogenase [Saonia flava]|uniref:Glucose/arabinose dehydrogenase n=1 Tax=Saonia flava TaxID=523696 RepID=A0A846QX69_9FLAO|nr:PQQ-dependent sugar dehydrogenase [Saonia flava]NJB69704.1 glucose/arabinose dehydrogenase [Saonia flava]
MTRFSSLVLTLFLLFVIGCKDNKKTEGDDVLENSKELPKEKMATDSTLSLHPKPDSDNGELFLPDGFGALIVIDSVGPSRHIAVNDNNDIYVKLRITTGDKGNVALRDTNNDGKADVVERFGEYPNDGAFATEMRIHNGYLYYSSELVVYRQKLTPGKLIPDGTPETILTDQFPIRWHNAKSLAFDNKGGMFVTFSAPTNACEDPNHRGETAKGMYPCPGLDVLGSIWRFDENKLGQFQSDGEIFATGLRSIVAISWNDEDNNLYAVNHGRDYLHNHDPKHFSQWQNAVLPAEEFMLIKKGDNYGWPYSYFDHFKNKRVLAPEYGGDGIQTTTGYTDPLMGLPAHWAPNDMLFYKGSMFPERYKEGAFIAFHGSTNRSPYPQAGYVVAFVPFKNGKPTGKWEVFADGFAGVDTIVDMKDAKYRPMGLAEGPDGSLYISESRQGKIWRVLYTDEKSNFKDSQLNIMEKRKSRSYIKTPDENLDNLLKNP